MAQLASTSVLALELLRSERPITRCCPALLTDSKICGERHAHSGPLKSPCRGGLEQSGRQRPRGGVAGGSGAGPSGVARAP
eukprot:1189094-Prorocentrum_minimum.AAC.2